jgi:hypothetical protein
VEWKEKEQEKTKAECGVIQREQEEETSYLVIMSGGGTFLCDSATLPIPETVTSLSKTTLEVMLGLFKDVVGSSNYETSNDEKDGK